MKVCAIGLCALAASPCLAAAISHTILVRDHLKGTSSELVVQAGAGDTTAGSWTGSLPGIDGFPTPPVSENPPYISKSALKPSDEPLLWPGRLAIRVDFITDEGEYSPICSGILVGPRQVLTAGHCVVERERLPDVGALWKTDSLFVRPGYNRGKDYPGMLPIRVVRSTASKFVILDTTEDVGDNDWAILELASDIGTRLGWAQVVPMADERENKPIHMMGYPVKSLGCKLDGLCDTASRKDTLCHSWGPLERKHFRPSKDWTPLVTAWPGESGSPVLDCPDDACRTGKLRVRGTRWTIYEISAIDSTMSGVIASILKDVKIPEPAMRASKPSEPVLKMRWTSAGLEVETDSLARIEVLDARGTSLLRTGKGKKWTLERLNRIGVLLVAVRYGNGLTKTVAVASTRE